ncbi:MAG: ComEC/Rec2 family competence protein [Candidatus Dormibacteria bacterium]
MTAAAASVGLGSGPGWVAALMVMALARGLVAVPQPGPGTLDGHLGARFVLEGTAELVSPATVAGQRFRLSSVRLDGVPVSGTAMVRVRSGDEVADGDRVLLARADLEALPRLSPGGTAGYDERLRRAGVVAMVRAPGVSLVRSAQPGPGLLLSGARRVVVAEFTEALPAPESALLLGEAMGIRRPLPTGVDEDLVRTGLAHVLALSGLKVAVVAGLATALGRRLFGRAGAAIALPAAALYIASSGFSASAARAGLMGSASTIGHLLRRDTDPMRSLLLAAAGMLVASPALVADASFQFSFLGVAGINIAAARIAPRVPLPPLLAESVAVTTAAQLATWPLTAMYFHVVPILSPASNAMVVPWLGPMVGGSLLLAIAWALPALHPVLLPLQVALFGGAHATLAIAHLLAAVPAALAVPWFNWPHAVGSYMAMVAIGAIGASGSTARRRTTLTLVALILATAVTLLLGRPDGRLHARFLALPGASVLIEAPDGARALVNTGTSAVSLAAALDSAISPLPPRGRRLEMVILGGSTRPASGGLAALAGWTVDAVAVPASPGLSEAVAAVPGLPRPFLLGDGEVLRWHGLLLQSIARGGSDLAVVVSWGATRLLLDPGAPDGAPPPGGYNVAGIGEANPSGTMTAGVRARLLVRQGTAKPGGRQPAAGTWDTSVEGEIQVSCTRQGCAW